MHHLIINNNHDNFILITARGWITDTMNGN